MQLMNYCNGCGLRRTEMSDSCSNCGYAFSSPYRAEDISPKSFGTAVALCSVLGLAGIHHFYLGNILHGLFDLGLLVAALFLLNGHDEMLALLGGFLLIVDIFHSGAVMYLLFTGRTQDGRGRLVVYPGQLQ